MLSLQFTALDIHSGLTGIILLYETAQKVKPGVVHQDLVKDIIFCIWS